MKFDWNAKFLSVVAGCLLVFSAHAVEPDEMLPDQSQEDRARAITRDLRCVVCQNQSVDDSDAPLAKDIRIIVRERIAAGATDEEVIDFVVQRYGQYVLLRPPLSVSTALIWIGPFALLAIALLVGLNYIRRRQSSGPPPAPLSADEQRALDAKLRDSAS